MFCFAISVAIPVHAYIRGGNPILR